MNRVGYQRQRIRESDKHHQAKGLNFHSYEWKVEMAGDWEGDD